MKTQDTENLVKIASKTDTATRLFLHMAFRLRHRGDLGLSQD